MATLSLVGDGSLTGAEALAWMELLYGPANRLVWQGDLAGSPRSWAFELLKSAITLAYKSGGEPREAAVVADLWMSASRGVSVLGTAWQVDEHIPGALGVGLRAVLDAHGEDTPLKNLWRPSRFVAARDALTKKVVRQPVLHAQPAHMIWEEARADARRLLEEARKGVAQPSDVPLIRRDVASWASESRGRHKLLAGVQVWTRLVELLEGLQVDARALVDHWTTDEPAESLLPSQWRTKLGLQSQDCCRFVEAVLYDFDLERDARALPRSLDLDWQWTALHAFAESRDVHCHSLLLALVDELKATGCACEDVAWVQEAQRYLRGLEDAVTSLRGRATRRLRVVEPGGLQDSLHEVLDQLSEASEHLRGRETREAEAWVGLARGTLDDAVQDAELAELESEVSALHARLEAAASLPPDMTESALLADPSDPRSLLAVRDLLLNTAHTVSRRLEERAEDVASQLESLHGEGRLAAGQFLYAALRKQLAEGDLAGAMSGLKRIEGLIRGDAKSVEDGLDASLLNLLFRARRAGFTALERRSLEKALVRVRDRDDAGLSTEEHRAALAALVDGMETQALDGLPLLAVGRKNESLAPVAWWESAVAVDAARFEGLAPLAGVIEGKLYLLERAGDAWVASKLLARRHRLLPVIQTDEPWQRAPSLPRHLRGWSGQLYVNGPKTVHGPYAVRGGRLDAYDARGLVAAMPTADFWALFGKLEVAHFGHPESHVVDPPSLAEMVMDADWLVDRHDEADDRRWLEALVEALDGATAGAVARALAHVKSMDLPAPIMERRIERLQSVLAVSETLETARERAVQAWLESPAGAQAKADAVAASVATTRAAHDEASATDVRDTVGTPGSDGPDRD